MNARSLVIRPEATAEANQAHEHYLEIDSSLGSRFLSRLNEAIARVHGSPELYAPVWRDSRRCRETSSGSSPEYRLHDSFVEMTAIMHGSRDHAAWQSRAGATPNG